MFSLLLLISHIFFKLSPAHLLHYGFKIIICLFWDHLQIESKKIRHFYASLKMASIIYAFTRKKNCLPSLFTNCFILFINVHVVPPIIDPFTDFPSRNMKGFTDSSSVLSATPTITVVPQFTWLASNAARYEIKQEEAKVHFHLEGATRVFTVQLEHYLRKWEGRSMG